MEFDIAPEKKSYDLDVKNLHYEILEHCLKDSSDLNNNFITDEIRETHDINPKLSFSMKKIQNLGPEHSLELIHLVFEFVQKYFKALEKFKANREKLMREVERVSSTHRSLLMNKATRSHDKEAKSDIQSDFMVHKQHLAEEIVLLDDAQEILFRQLERAGFDVFYKTLKHLGSASMRAHLTKKHKRDLERMALLVDSFNSEESLESKEARDEMGKVSRLFEEVFGLSPEDAFENIPLTVHDTDHGDECNDDDNEEESLWATSQSESDSPGEHTAMIQGVESPEMITWLTSKPARIHEQALEAARLIRKRRREQQEVVGKRYKRRAMLPKRTRRSTLDQTVVQQQNEKGKMEEIDKRLRWRAQKKQNVALRVFKQSVERLRRRNIVPSAVHKVSLSGPLTHSQATNQAHNNADLTYNPSDASFQYDTEEELDNEFSWRGTQELRSPSPYLDELRRLYVMRDVVLRRLSPTNHPSFESSPIPSGFFFDSLTRRASSFGRYHDRVTVLESSALPEITHFQNNSDSPTSSRMHNLNIQTSHDAILGTRLYQPSKAVDRFVAVSQDTSPPRGTAAEREGKEGEQKKEEDGFGEVLTAADIQSYVHETLGEGSRPPFHKAPPHRLFIIQINPQTLLNIDSVIPLVGEPFEDYLNALKKLDTQAQVAAASGLPEVFSASLHSLKEHFLLQSEALKDACRGDFTSSSSATLKEILQRSFACSEEGSWPRLQQQVLSVLDLAVTKLIGSWKRVSSEPCGVLLGSLPPLMRFFSWTNTNVLLHYVAHATRCHEDLSMDGQPAQVSLWSLNAPLQVRFQRSHQCLANHPSPQNGRLSSALRSLSFLLQFEELAYSLSLSLVLDRLTERLQASLAAAPDFTSVQMVELLLQHQTQQWSELLQLLLFTPDLLPSLLDHISLRRHSMLLGLPFQDPNHLQGRCVRLEELLDSLRFRYEDPSGSVLEALRVFLEISWLGLTSIIDIYNKLPIDLKKRSTLGTPSLKTWTIFNELVAGILGRSNDRLFPTEDRKGLFNAVSESRYHVLSDFLGPHSSRRISTESLWALLVLYTDRLLSSTSHQPMSASPSRVVANWRLCVTLCRYSMCHFSSLSPEVDLSNRSVWVQWFQVFHRMTHFCRQWEGPMEGFIIVVQQLLVPLSGHIHLLFDGSIRHSDPDGDSEGQWEAPLPELSLRTVLPMCFHGYFQRSKYISNIVDAPMSTQGQDLRDSMHRQLLLIASMTFKSLGAPNPYSVFLAPSGAQSALEQSLPSGGLWLGQSNNADPELGINFDSGILRGESKVRSDSGFFMNVLQNVRFHWKSLLQALCGDGSQPAQRMNIKRIKFLMSSINVSSGQTRDAPIQGDLVQVFHERPSFATGMLLCLLLKELICIVGEDVLGPQGKTTVGTSIAIQLLQTFIHTPFISKQQSDELGESHSEVPLKEVPDASSGAAVGSNGSNGNVQDDKLRACLILFASVITFVPLPVRTLNQTPQGRAEEKTQQLVRQDLASLEPITAFLGMVKAVLHLEVQRSQLTDLGHSLLSSGVALVSTLFQYLPYCLYSINDGVEANSVPVELSQLPFKLIHNALGLLKFGFQSITHQSARDLLCGTRPASTNSKHAMSSGAAVLSWEERYLLPFSCIYTLGSILRLLLQSSLSNVTDPSMSHGYQQWTSLLLLLSSSQEIHIPSSLRTLFLQLARATGPAPRQNLPGADGSSSSITGGGLPAMDVFSARFSFYPRRKKALFAKSTHEFVLTQCDLPLDSTPALKEALWPASVCRALLRIWSDTAELLLRTEWMMHLVVGDVDAGVHPWQGSIALPPALQYLKVIQQTIQMTEVTSSTNDRVSSSWFLCLFWGPVLEVLLSLQPTSSSSKAASAWARMTQPIFDLCLSSATHACLECLLTIEAKPLLISELSLFSFLSSLVKVGRCILDLGYSSHVRVLPDTLLMASLINSTYSEIFVAPENEFLQAELIAASKPFLKFSLLRLSLIEQTSQQELRRVGDMVFRCLRYLMACRERAALLSLRTGCSQGVSFLRELFLLMASHANLDRRLLKALSPSFNDLQDSLIPQANGPRQGQTFKVFSTESIDIFFRDYYGTPIEAWILRFMKNEAFANKLNESDVAELQSLVDPITLAFKLVNEVPYITRCRHWEGILRLLLVLEASAGYLSALRDQCFFAVAFASAIPWEAALFEEDLLGRIQEESFTSSFTHLLTSHCSLLTESQVCQVLPWLVSALKKYFFLRKVHAAMSSMCQSPMDSTAGCLPDLNPNLAPILASLATSRRLFANYLFTSQSENVWTKAVNVLQHLASDRASATTTATIPAAAASQSLKHNGQGEASLINSTRQRLASYAYGVEETLKTLLPDMYK